MSIAQRAATKARKGGRSLLLIEESPHRIETFVEWLADTEFQLIVGRTRGEARHALTSLGARKIWGVLLDQDYDGVGLMRLIARNVRSGAPVLIHSHKASTSGRMHEYFKSAGFSVTRIRFAALTKEVFDDWLQDVRESWCYTR